MEKEICPLIRQLQLSFLILLLLTLPNTLEARIDNWSCSCRGSSQASGSGARLVLELNLARQDTARDMETAANSSFELKSESAAFRASLLATLIPLPTIVLTLPGLIVGPSWGYFKSDLNGRGWLGIGIRTIGVGGIIGAFGICGWDCGPGDDSYDLAWAVFIAGSAITVGSAIYDIATVKQAVRDHNAKLMQVPVSLRPVYLADHEVPGVGISLRW